MSPVSPHSRALQTKKTYLDIQREAPALVSLPRQAKTVERESRISLKKIDGIQSPASLLETLKKQSLKDSVLRVFRKYELFSRRFQRFLSHFVPTLAPRKLFYGSLSGGVALGMVGMGFVGQLSGPDVSAQSSQTSSVAAVETAPEAELPPYNFENDIFFEYFNDGSEEAYQERVRQVVAGYPIEEMLPYIFEKDHLVAAFLIGIAKKESNWGKRVPVLNGQDCFNYWGYRGIRKMMGTGGHTCFNSRKDAVDTVAKRLETLIHDQKLDTPEKLIIWKCGYSCEGHSRESVKKWIADVDYYFREASYE